MGIKPKTISTRVSLFFFFLNILACAPSPHFYLQDRGPLTHAHLNEVMAEKPLSPDQNIKGDILFIPRGSAHYFVNTFSEPSVALAVFSPDFDGKDSIPEGKPRLGSLVLPMQR